MLHCYLDAAHEDFNMRRSLAYSRKQGEQVTTCETGRSFKVNRRSRYAIARKVEEFGQPSRVGFGNEVLEYFFPRATTSLTCLVDTRIGWIQSSEFHSPPGGFNRDLW